MASSCFNSVLEQAINVSHNSYREILDKYTEDGILNQYNVEVWSRLWFAQNGIRSIYLSIVYLIIIFYLRRCMEDRKPFILRKQLFYWNLFLATFSIVGSIRSLPEMISILTQPSGFYLSVCSRNHFTTPGSIWLILFVWSKAIELGDTLFIVLRKRPLNFLHWYHHITVLCYCWIFYPEYSSTQRWFCLMNYLVHSVMYTYFALRAIDIKVPRSISIWITRIQIIQMVFGLSITIYSLAIKWLGGECKVNEFSSFMGFLMYLSYFILFANFFLKTYSSNKTKQQGKSVVVDEASKIKVS